MSLTFTGPVPIPSPQLTGLTILITGSSRGIGFNLVKQYSESHPDNLVFAAVRDVKAQSSQQVVQYAKQHKNVLVIPVDTSSSNSITASVSHVTQFSDHIDILINNAGVLGEGDPNKVTAEEMIRVYNVNVVGPLIVVQSYLPLLLKSQLPAKVIGVSSGLGSNQYAWALGAPFISYGTSKAALNYITSVLKGSFPQLTFLTIHPGWVDTEMGNDAGGKPPTNVEESVQAIRYYIQEKQNKNSGEFLDVMTGQLLPY